MTVEEKLTILTDAAKYDVACTSSGGDRRGGRLGKTLPSGCCHTFSADGRCISLLKLLLTNVCIYDCQYCVNRTSHDLPRAMFTPRGAGRPHHRLLPAQLHRGGSSSAPPWCAARITPRNC